MMVDEDRIYIDNIESYLMFLDAWVLSYGTISLICSVPYLMGEFLELDRNTAEEVLKHWMVTFEERHPTT